MWEALRRRIDGARAAWLAHRKASRGVTALPSTVTPAAYQGSVHDPLVAVEDAVALTRRQTYATVFEVTGMPVDAMSPAAAEAFLTHWAGCLNTLRHKHGVQFVVHHRPGGLTPYVNARREALVRHHTQEGGRGLGSPLAVLERDQVEHLARLDASGGATSVSFYVVVDAPDRLTYQRQPEPGVACVEANFHSEAWPVRIPPRAAALVLVDVWDTHLITSHAARTTEIARTRIAPAVAAARGAGVTVVHAPSPVQARRYPQWTRYATEEDARAPAARIWPFLEADDWPPPAFRRREGP